MDRLSAHPQLIVDLRFRSVSAAALTAEGFVVPCRQQASAASGYFSSEIFLDPDFDHHTADRELGLLSKCTVSNALAVGHSLGLRQPGETGGDSRKLVRLHHPLRVLSSVEAMLDRGRRQALRGAAYGLTDALLAPIFSALSAQGQEPREMSAEVVIPGSLGRQARVILAKIFRARGFRRIRLLPRELAAAMSLIDDSLSEVLVVDADDEDLHFHRVTLDPHPNKRILACRGSRTARGLGWSFWIRELAAALKTGGELRFSEDELRPLIDRALLGLLGAPYSTDVPAVSGPPIRMTFGLLNELLRSLSPEGRERLTEATRRAIRELGVGDAPWLGLGSAFAVGRFDELLQQAIGAERLRVRLQVPALERCIHGVASALRWLRESPDRQIEASIAGSLRVSTLRGESIELVPWSLLHRLHPGQRHRARQLLRIEGNIEGDRRLPIHLVWGADPNPDSAAAVCALPLDLGGSKKSVPEELEIALDLRLNRAGRKLSGTVRAACGDAFSIKKLETVDPLVRLRAERASLDLPATSSAPVRRSAGGHP